MGMEGINWSEVNSQVEKISRCFGDFGKSIKVGLRDFRDELAYVWASGNAVKFGENVTESSKELDTVVHEANLEIAEEIKKAVQIYSEKFNVSQAIDCVVFGGYFDANLQYKNPLRETVNGITGMNKTVVTELMNNYIKTCETAYETFNNDLSSINIAIYDNAGAQQEAFRGAVKTMIDNINKILNALFDEVKAGINTEIDNVELAKSQTTSTFNSN